MRRRGGRAAIVVVVAAACLAPRIASASWGDRASVQADSRLVERTADGHADDLQVAFTVSGLPTDKDVVISVSAERSSDASCARPDHVKVEDVSTSGQFLTDSRGEITGVLEVPISVVGDVCYPGSTVNWYHVAYKEIALTIEPRGGPTLTTPSELSYDYEPPRVCTPDLEALGACCTVESVESGHCESN
jgi:hypothetical protein